MNTRTYMQCLEIYKFTHVLHNTYEISPIYTDTQTQACARKGGCCSSAGY